MNERDRTLAMADASRQAVRDASQFGDLFREQRIRIGASQAAIGRLVGVSRVMVWRVEHGDPGVWFDTRARCARAVGGTARLSFFPDAAPLIYDSAQARIAERIVEDASPIWRRTLEAQVPGSRMRVDVRLENLVDVVLMEIETNVRRWEALLRELFAKRDALLKAGEARAVHIVLVLPPTRHHRELIGALAASVRSALPVTSRELRRALVDGGRWPGDGILWLGGGRGRAGEAA